MRDREFKRDRNLPARYERERIFHQDVYNERAFDAFALCGGKDVLTGIGAIAFRIRTDGILALQAIREARHFFLLCLRKVTNFIEDGFFQIHGRPFR